MTRWGLPFVTFSMALGFVLAPKVSAQQLPVPDSTIVKSGLLNSSVSFAEQLLDAFTFESGRNTIAVVPVLGYSPQTGLEYGVMPVWRILPKHCPDSAFYRPTVISSYLLCSTTGMFEADIDLDAFVWQNYRLTAQTRALYLPDKFYGIGNQSVDAVFEPYDARRLQFKGSFARQLGQAWFVGVYVDVDNTQNTPPVSSQGNEVTGGSGGFLSALGPTVAFDNRNSATYPTNGYYVRGWYVASDVAWGSDYDYSQFNIDGRCFALVGKSVLASQLQLISGNGHAPFYRLAALGGKRGLRGIPHPLKYINNNMWLFQTEYRTHIWWRFGGVLFGGVGEVAEKWDATFSNVKCTAGAGLRFNIFPNEKLNCRFDFGVASGGDHAFYFSLNESF
jgi:hypothetical protein